MNIKTTLFLILLLALGAGGAYLVYQRQPKEIDSPTVAFLKDDLTADNLSRIEIRHGNHTVIFQRSADKKEWSLPGKWPVREHEVKRLVDTVTGLQSRFVPTPIKDDAELKEFGLAKNTLTLKVTVGGSEHTLLLGEQPGDVNKFARATFARLDDQKEVVRLAPGLIALLSAGQDVYQQRRLFAAERVAKGGDPSEKVEQLVAREIVVSAPDTSFDLAKVDNRWEMKKPVLDRVDPDKLKSILVACPDIWAERFIEDKPSKARLAEFGLEKPGFELTVKRLSGDTLKMLIGKTSRTEERKIEKPAPPASPFTPPMPPRFEVVKEEFRYAKLAENDQVFEIKADRLKDIAVPFARLRDPRLARFQTDEVQRAEIEHAGQEIVLVKGAGKDKEGWQLEKPSPYEAENSQVSELLGKLADLQSQEFLDKADPKVVGLEKPVVVVKLSIASKAKEEPSKAGEPKSPARSIAYHFGSSEKEKGKLYVQVAGWPRVNVIDDAILKLLERPALAYRSRRLLDAPVADLTQIDIERGKDAFSFTNNKGTWRLSAPVAADVDAGKAGALASAVGRIDAVEMIADAPKEEDLDKTYGLAKPVVQAKIHFADKTTKTLSLGNRRGKDEYFARLDQGPVFAVRKDLFEQLDRDSQSYCSDKLWDLVPADVTEIAIHKQDPEFRLQRLGSEWKVAAPFPAGAVGFLCEKLASELARLKADSFVDLKAKDLTVYGLEKPYLRVRVITASADKKTKEHTLLIGKEKGKNEGRFARIDGSDAVFLLNEKALAGLDRSVFDFLDKTLLTLEPAQIQTIRGTGTAPFTLEKKKDAWQVVDSPAAPFAADEESAQNYLQAWANVRVEKIVDYGPKIDWARYGLEKPLSAFTVVTKGPGKEDKTIQHTLYLGKEAPDGERYARLDQNPEVVTLAGFMIKELAKSHLDFVNPLALKFARDSAVGLARQTPGGDFEITKKADETWHLANPDRPADALTMDKILDATFRLRAQSVAAYPLKELAPFGLDNPTAVITIKLADAAGKAEQHVIRIGKKAGADAKTAGNYALVDKADAVIVLAPELARMLLSPTINFADRNLANLFGVDQIVLQRGDRRAIFLLESGTWAMADPVRADAESTELAQLVRELARLRADEMVAEKADPKTYGLDRPLIDCKLMAQGKIVLDLAVGAAEQGDGKNPRRFAKLANKDAIFLLNPQISARILEEFRSRKVWESFDAAQVERLSFEGPGNTFTLIKQGPFWMVQDKFDAKVNAKLVTDTLDALARLKAQRYAVDAKANLQLYGLVPPTLKVEADTPAGKRTLLIGAAEGTTQRRYASIAGGDAVFVLDAADAQRIMRSLATFTQESKDAK